LQEQSSVLTVPQGGSGGPPAPRARGLCSLAVGLPKYVWSFEHDAFKINITSSFGDSSATPFVFVTTKSPTRERLTLICFSK